jgi:hypothetical protein
MWLTAEYWQKMMRMDVEDRVRQCCEKREGNMRVESWASRLKESVLLTECRLYNV